MFFCLVTGSWFWDSAYFNNTVISHLLAFICNWLSDTWYWRKTQFSIFQLKFSKQVGKKKQVGTFLFSCMMLTFGRLKWFRFYSFRLKTNLHLKLISIKTKLRSLIQSPADQTSFDWKWSKSSVWWVRTVQLLSAQTFLQFNKAIRCTVWQLLLSYY